MAAGLPVVYCASGESAVSELVRHGREGLAAAADPDGLAAAMATLLSDGEEAARLGGNALARARAYDWDRIAERFQDLFYGLLEDASSS